MNRMAEVKNEVLTEWRVRSEFPEVKNEQNGESGQDFAPFASKRSKY
jgi:hypothetical protein